MNTPDANSVPAESQSGFGGEISKEAREALGREVASKFTIRWFPNITPPAFEDLYYLALSAIDRALSSVKEAQPKEKLFGENVGEALAALKPLFRDKAPTTQEQQREETGIAFRKKPVVIRAIEVKPLTSSRDHLDAIRDFMGGEERRNIDFGINYATGEVNINTLEGTMKARVGDWIIKGVKGEFYPCKPDIMEATYERVPQIPNERHEASVSGAPLSKSVLTDSGSGVAEKKVAADAEAPPTSELQSEQTGDTLRAFPQDVIALWKTSEWSHEYGTKQHGFLYFTPEGTPNQAAMPRVWIPNGMIIDIEREHNKTVYKIICALAQQSKG